jgi:hypothetical protein
MPDGIPPYVLVARITSILGMSFALAIGLLLLIGGWLLLSLLAFALFAPSFGLLVLIERFAAGKTDIEDIEDAEGA